MWSAAGWGECEDGATPPPPRRRVHRVPMAEAASTVEEKAGAVAAVAEVLVVAAAKVEAAVTARVPVADVVSSAEPSVELMEPSVELSVVSSVELSGVTSIVSSVELSVEMSVEMSGVTSGPLGSAIGSVPHACDCMGTPAMGVGTRKCASMGTVVGYVRAAEAERASGVSPFSQMLGPPETSLMDWCTVSGEEGDTCWSRSLLESNFVMLLLMFVIDMLMRAGPGQQRWDSTILNNEEYVRKWRGVCRRLSTYH